MGTNFYAHVPVPDEPLAVVLGLAELYVVDSKIAARDRAAIAVVRERVDNPAVQVLHIGKSSMGWKFSFRAHPDLGLLSWAAWRKVLSAPGVTIRDEYGDVWSLAELTERVTVRTAPRDLDRPICRVMPTPAEINLGFGGRWSPNDNEFHDPEGFDFHAGEFS